MEIWAGATRELVASAMEERPGTDVDFLLGIIQQSAKIRIYSGFAGCESIPGATKDAAAAVLGVSAAAAC